MTPTPPPAPELSAHRPVLSAFLADPAQQAGWFTFGPVRCYLRKGFRRVPASGEPTGALRVLELVNVEIAPGERGRGWGHALLRLLVAAGAPVYAEHVLSEALAHLLHEHGFRRLDGDRLGLGGDYLYRPGDERQVVSPRLDGMAR